MGQGGSQTFTITPQTGFHILAVNVDNGTVGTMSTFTFSNVESDHIIAVAFEQDATTIDRIPPTAPTNFQVVRGVGRVRMSWRRSTDNVGVTNYEIEYSRGSGFQNSQRLRVGNVRTAQVSGLANGVRYYFRVRALDAAGNVSNPTNRVSARPL